MLALTCADHYMRCMRVATTYEPIMIQDASFGDRLPYVIPEYIECATVTKLSSLIEGALRVPIGIISRGPTASDKEYLD
jgi:hypothetical protein